MVRFEVEITARMRRFPVDRHAEVGALSFNFRIEKRQLPVLFLPFDLIKAGATETETSLLKQYGFA